MLRNISIDLKKQRTPKIEYPQLEMLFTEDQDWVIQANFIVVDISMAHLVVAVMGFVDQEMAVIVAHV